MNVHKNARLTVSGRALLVQRILKEGLRPVEVAQSQGVSVRTAYKWLNRYRAEGEEGLQDRSSRPKFCPHALPEMRQEQVLELRRQRKTYRQISQDLKVGHSTVGRLLSRNGLNRLAYLEPPPPVIRYEYPKPGGLLHLDIKKLGRFNKPGHRVTRDRLKGRSYHVGWEYAHVAIDDNSRVAHSGLYADQSGRSACLALIRALRYYASLGVCFERVMTDNGPCYKSGRFKRLCRRLGLKHIYTKPYTPRKNGKAERFIQTALREWAYARSYESSDQRATYLTSWLHEYNWHRPHASLSYLPPISRIASVNNVVGLHS
ncbi:IS481 family transposase [Pseudomonas hormoni]